MQKQDAIRNHSGPQLNLAQLKFSFPHTDGSPGSSTRVCEVLPQGGRSKNSRGDPDKKLSVQEPLPGTSDADAASFMRVAQSSRRFLMDKVRWLLLSTVSKPVPYLVFTEECLTAP